MTDRLAPLSLRADPVNRYHPEQCPAIHERHQRLIHRVGRLDATRRCWANAASRSLSRSIQLWAMLCDAKSEVFLVGSPGLVRSTQYLSALVNIRR